MKIRQTIINKFSLLVLIGFAFATIFAFTNVVGATQLVLPATPTFNLPPVKATGEASLELTRQSAPPLTFHAPFTDTPGPTPTIWYADCPPKIAGDGLLFGRCRMTAAISISPTLKQYGANNVWEKQLTGGRLTVVAGNGWITIFQPGDFPIKAQAISISNGTAVEIIDARGSVLVLRSLSVTPSQYIYFDVDSRQIVTTLPTATPYPITLTGLRALLLSLNQQSKVDQSAFTALDAHLRSAENQLQQGNKTATLADLNSFIQVAQAQSGTQNGSHLTPEAAAQLIDLANKVRVSLQ